MVQAGEVHVVVFRLIKLVVRCSESLDTSSEGIKAVPFLVHFNGVERPRFCLRSSVCAPSCPPNNNRT